MDHSETCKARARRISGTSTRQYGAACVVANLSSLRAASARLCPNDNVERNLTKELPNRKLQVSNMLWGIERHIYKEIKAGSCGVWYSVDRTN